MYYEIVWDRKSPHIVVMLTWQGLCQASLRANVRIFPFIGKTSEVEKESRYEQVNGLACTTPIFSYRWEQI